MGKFMRKNRRADVAVMVEGLSGVRTRASELRNLSSNSHLLRKALEESMEQQPLKKRCSGSGEENQENLSSPSDVVPASAAAGGALDEPESGNSASPGEGIEDHADQQQQESTSEREDDELAHLEANSRLLLHESHSDSCLRSRACPITAHSRSNSATFTQDQINFSVFLGESGASDHMEVSEGQAANVRQEDQEEAQVLREVEFQEKASTKEAEPSCGDNTLVLFKAMKRSHEAAAELQEEAGLLASTSTPPASSSRSIFQSNHRRRRSAGDCGPGWRHRAASAPSAEEIEEFFAGVEGEKDDRRRFLDKYNFDVFNDVALPGRFEWVQLQQ